jgi:hypothetical protein
MLNYRIRVFVLTIAAVGFLAVPIERGAAAPAVTTNPLTVNGLYCLSLGGGRMECFASVSGGTGTYFYDWYPAATLDGDDGYMNGTCKPYAFNTQRVTVTDSAGATASRSYSNDFCGEAP